MIPKVDLCVGELGFIFYGKHLIQMSDPGPKGPLVQINISTSHTILNHNVGEE